MRCTLIYEDHITYHHFFVKYMSLYSCMSICKIVGDLLIIERQVCRSFSNMAFSNKKIIQQVDNNTL